MIDMAGIEKLRAISNSEVMIFTDVSEKGSPYCDTDTRGYAFVPEKAREAIARIADQIEREQAEELAAAKRDLTDEARETVERLHAVSHDDILRSVNPEHEIVDELCNAVGVVRQPTYTGTLDAICNRIIDLIERGGKRDVDVSALRELADELNAKIRAPYRRECLSPRYNDGMRRGIGDAPERIRKAVESAPKPDAESDAERACAALLDWRDQVAGMLGIDAGSMADEVQDAIMAELDKRLMPPGMEWLRYEDNEMVLPSDEGIIGIEYSRTGNTVLVTTNDDEPRVVFATGERVKRPEPEVLGADGKPIRDGETVWDSTSPNDPTSSTVWRHGGPLQVLRRNDVRAGFVICENDQGIPLDCCAADLTHAAPDTQERIDEDASVPPRRYYADKIGHDVGLKDDEEVFTAVALDLLRRQRELDAKKMGGES